MAETIFGQTPFSAAMEGYQQGVDIQQAKPQAEAQTTLLSARAEEAKMGLAAKKEAMATQMAARAARTDAALKNSNLDASTAQGQLKLIDVAINASKNNPELVDTLTQQKSQLLTEQAGIATAQMKLREEAANQVYDGIRGAFIDPSTTADQINTMASNATDPQTKAKLTGLSHILSSGSTIPVPGYGKPFSQLSPVQQETFKADIVRAFAPSKVEKTAADIMAEQIKLAQLEEKRKKDEEDNLNKQRKIAVDREKVSRAAEKARDKSTQLAQLETKNTADLNKVDQKQMKILQDAGVATPEDKVPTWFGLGKDKDKLSPADQAAYQRLEVEKGTIQRGYLAARAKLEAASQVAQPKPDAEIKIAVTQHGWEYEPSKYEYRLGPDGVPQRKLKGK